MWRELLFIIDAKGMGMPVIGDKKTGKTIIVHHNGATQKNIIKKLKAGEVVDF